MGLYPWDWTFGFYGLTNHLHPSPQALSQELMFRKRHSTARHRDPEIRHLGFVSLLDRLGVGIAG